MDQQSRDYLDKGFTLVTSTDRITRQLQHQYAHEQLTRGIHVWESAEILHWNAWLSRFWADYAAKWDIDQLVLIPGQQLAVWQQQLAQSQYVGRLLQPAAAARHAVDAWNLCQQWLIPIFPGATFLNEDARAFQGWADGYKSRCETNGWLDEANLAGFLAGDIDSRAVNLENKIALIGFDEFTPQQQSFLHVLGKAGCDIQVQELNNSNQRVTRAGFNDAREEIMAAANWAKGLLQSDPTVSAGIVVPDLPSLRNKIDNGLENVLCPDALLSRPDDNKRPYNIALGQALSDYPVIDAALQIIGLGNQSLPLDEIGGLLRSPFMRGAQKEGAKRALLDACLHDYGEPQLSVNSVLHIGSYNIEQHNRCNELLELLQNWMNNFQALPSKQTAHQWAAAFSQLLKVTGWPGERKLNSFEYQAVEAWQKLINQFAAMDLVISGLSYSTALVYLRQLASAYSFQPQTAEAPVQVIGIAGAAGMCFDHLWIMGLHEDVWPAPARPNQFIPIALQREAGLPDAAADLKLDQAESITQRLVMSAVDVILSYPRTERERNLRPSPLTGKYPEAKGSFIKPSVADYAETIFTSKQTESLSDDQAPQMQLGMPVSGGTALFRDMAACPFRAFARHRLHARPLPEADIGLDAMQRGNLVHRMMYLFWQKTGSHERLLALDTEALAEIIDAVVNKIINTDNRHQPFTYPERFALLEQMRLKNLLREWLEQERQRSPFVVTVCEQQSEQLIEGLVIKTRIDRIDQIPDGRMIIIDYKTGSASIRDWFGERPDDPQLPLYAVSNKEAGVAAISFASIKRGEMTYAGLAEDSGILPGIEAFSGSRYTGTTATWQALMMDWQQVLSGLAVAFRAGDARVDPKKAETCRYCDLHSLCRVYENDNKNPDAAKPQPYSLKKQDMNHRVQ